MRCAFSDELRRAHAETGDSEHEIQQLQQELKGAQDLARINKQKCLEVQGEPHGVLFTDDKWLCWKRAE